MQGEDEVEKTYIAIDLKSFYASCELAGRKRNPLTTNLVVADPTRTEKTICLAVSPSLKEYGIPGRARLFEVVQKVKEVNAQRMAKASSLGLLIKDPETGKECFRAASEDAEALQADPSLELAYIIAPPRMKKYEEISTRISIAMAMPQTATSPIITPLKSSTETLVLPGISLCISSHPQW